MFRISLSININKPRWFNRLFKCKHKPVRVEENFYSRYGTHTSYVMCLKCGRTNLEPSCKHDINLFGTWSNWLIRFNNPCESIPHVWCKEPDVDAIFCSTCGEWKEIEYLNED